MKARIHSLAGRVCPEITTPTPLSPLLHLLPRQNEGLAKAMGEGVCLDGVYSLNRLWSQVWSAGLEVGTRSCAEVILAVNSGAKLHINKTPTAVLRI